MLRAADLAELPKEARADFIARLSPEEAALLPYFWEFWAAGGGLEWAFPPSWSARVEYLHADLGTHAASFPGFAYGSVPSFPVPQQFLADVPMRANTVKIGVSYHFNGLLTGDPAKDFPAAPSL